MTPESTRSGTGTINEPVRHASETSVEGLVNRVGAVRDTVQVIGEDVEGLHGEVRQHALDARTGELAQGDPSELLEELAGGLGLSWTLIAKLMGVSQTAVRKWRRGETVAPENRRGIARLAAFLQMLGEAAPGMCDPASWLEVRISDEATLTGADLYILGRYELLLDFAGLRLAPHEVLYTLDPGWQRRYAPDGRFEVVDAPDGGRSIVVRDDT